MDLKSHQINRATQLIEDLMIAPSGVRAVPLSQNFPTLRRVVRIPKRWTGLSIWRSTGEMLPAEPDAQALENFLQESEKRDPESSPTSRLRSSSSGTGEYVINIPGGVAGHFRLAVNNYSHSTRPTAATPMSSRSV